MSNIVFLIFYAGVSNETSQHPAGLHVALGDRAPALQTIVLIPGDPFLGPAGLRANCHPLNILVLLRRVFLGEPSANICTDNQ